MRPATKRAALTARRRTRRRFACLPLTSDVQDMRDIEEAFGTAIDTLVRLTGGPENYEAQLALGVVTTMTDVALRHMRKSRHSELLSESRTVTIAAFMDGAEVIRGAA